MGITHPGRELMELTVGGWSREDLRAALDREGVGLNASAEELLGRAEMECPARTLSLVVVTASELGFPEGGAFSEILAAAAGQGLTLCPLATGPHLRLLLREAESSDPELRRQRPPDGALHVASAVLDPAFEVPKGFYLRTVEGRRWLRGYRCDEDYVVPPTTTYVFARGATVGSYDDPRLAIIYDVDNPDGPDHDFFRAIADEMRARRIVDLGCGTGILTVTLTAPGRQVIGIDPAPAMLDRAKNRPGGDAVHWVEGTAEQIEPGSADLVIMSGNVAMHIIGDEWPATLQRIADGLAVGERLVFESRNPQARAWLAWNEPLADRDTPVGALRESLVTDPPDAAGVVTMHCHNEFLDDGAVIDIDQRLQFRSHQQIVDDLARVGLRVLATHRNWARDPFTGGADQPLMIFVAERS